MENTVGLMMVPLVHSLFFGAASLAGVGNVLLVAGCALLGLWFARVYRRKTRELAVEYCKCGYNLTGNTSGTCPECGTAVEGKAQALKNKLLSFIALVSLLLCLATVVLWVRSYRVLTWATQGESLWSGTVEVESVCGELAYTWWKTFPLEEFVSPDWQSHGFAFGNEPGCLIIVVPHWAIVLVTAILPVRLVIIRRRFRYAEAACRSCSYDLTGNTSGVCPECGTAIPAAGRGAGGMIGM